MQITETNQFSYVSPLKFSVLQFADDDHHGSDGAHFGYGDPDQEWPTDYPICGGSRQSPINIELQEVKMTEAGRPPLGRFGYDTRPLKMKIANNGHSGKIVI